MDEYAKYWIKQLGYNKEQADRIMKECRDRERYEKSKSVKDYIGPIMLTKMCNDFITPN